jgi:hypothetical protein
MIISGTTWSFVKSSAQSPMMKPNKLKVTAVSTRKPTIHTGCSISYGTKTRAVARMSAPIITDFVAAAPT